MHKMIKVLTHITSGIMLSLAMTTHIALAEEHGVSSPVYINGGIGQEESDEFRNQAHDYNLRLYFSAGKIGKYIADVPVTIKDKRGNVIFNLASAGPLLFLKMTKGTYFISSEYRGVTLKQRVNVMNHRGENIYLNWKNN